MSKEVTLAADAKPPTILGREDLHQLLGEMSGLWLVLAEVIYFTGMRPREAVGLRYRDVDLGGRLIRVTDDQGETDRVLRFPRALETSLGPLQTAVEALYRWDVGRGFGEASVPVGAHLKTHDAHRQLSWQYYFPNYERVQDDIGNTQYRHHVELLSFEEELQAAAFRAELPVPISGYTLRHTRAVALLRHGHSVTKVGSILGQSDAALTRRYLPLVEASSGRRLTRLSAAS